MMTTTVMTTFNQYTHHLLPSGILRMIQAIVVERVQLVAVKYTNARTQTFVAAESNFNHTK